MVSAREVHWLDALPGGGLAHLPIAEVNDSRERAGVLAVRQVPTAAEDLSWGERAGGVVLADGAIREAGGNDVPSVVR
ncbi:MAG: hypothetical protein C4340_03570 [Armatimonadota bacterium]